MSSIPANLARVPNSLVTRTTLSNLTRTNVDLLRITEQLTTAKRLNRPSDNPRNQPRRCLVLPLKRDQVD